MQHEQIPSFHFSQQVRMSYAQRNLQTALSEKNVAGFYAALWQFVGIIVVAAPSFALAGWLEVHVHGQLFPVTRSRCLLPPSRCYNGDSASCRGMSCCTLGDAV